MTPDKSPGIVKAEWGVTRVENEPATMKDVKLFPGGAREWDWNETGTRHTPGILPADVAELIEHGATHVILSSGYLSRLRLAPETEAYLRDAGVSFEFLRSDRAVERYNELAVSVKVGALIHSTC